MTTPFKTHFRGALLGLLACMAASTAVAADPGSEKLREFMRVKLTSSHEIVNGFVTENKTQITEAAKRMIAMSHADEWYAIKTPEFEGFSARFRADLEGLIANTKDDHMQAAATNFGAVLGDCVSCHASQRKPKN
jgi:cytochrome c556